MLNENSGISDTTLPWGQERSTIKVGMVSLGCNKNQVDSEHMLWDLREAGYELCTDAGLCDVVIINTCGFIESAKQESIEYILEFCTLKQEGRIKVVVVTGCLAERYKEQVKQEIPEADVILGIGSNSELVAAIENALAGKQTMLFGDKLALSMEGGRIISNLPFFAYLKVAEGCNNRCTYCAIPMIRGKFRSREMQNIVDEAEFFVANGVTELCVVAQDTTRYGEDLYGESHLPQLLSRLCKIDGLQWIRILYCYPERVTDELLNVMATEKKIVPYMDIPIQHVAGDVLKRMNRHGDAEFLRNLINKIRARVPGITLRTTLITGFPGETEEEFEELCEFVSDMRFERLGCFAYSREEDTPAYDMPGQIDAEVKARRAEVIMEMQMGIVYEHNKALRGKTLTVLCEGFDRYAESWYGRSYMDAPDIDAKVFFTTTQKVEPGDYVEVEITDMLDYDLIGEAIV